MKKKKLEKKRRSTTRERNWEGKHEHAFSRDLARHRKAQVTLREHVAGDDALPKDFEPNALVVSHSKRWAFVLMEGREQLCIIDERLRADDATLLVPGDRVLVEFEGDDALVRGIAPRTTRLSRPAPGDRETPFEQVFAANLEVLLVVASAASPPFRPGLVDRFLIAAQVGGVTPLLCLNKVDLVDDEPAELASYRALGIQVFKTSCQTREGLDELREALGGKLCVVCGHSGVGKSSLVNALDPNLAVHTQEVSQSTDRGRHTTTNGRLYELAGGIRIIDTPGIRALGLWEVSPESLAFYFPEIAEAAAGCKFRNCTHVHEPECAVLAGVAQGAISGPRFESYRRIRASLESDTGVTPGRMAAKFIGEK